MPRLRFTPGEGAYDGASGTGIEVEWSARNGYQRGLPAIDGIRVDSGDQASRSVRIAVRSRQPHTALPCRRSPIHPLHGTIRPRRDPRCCRPSTASAGRHLRDRDPGEHVGAGDRAASLSRYSFQLPHFGDCTHDGQPSSHGHAATSSARCVQVFGHPLERELGDAGAARDSRRRRRSSARRSGGASPSTRRRRPSGRRS